MIAALERRDDRVVLGGRALDPRRVAHVQPLVAQQRLLTGRSAASSSALSQRSVSDAMEVVVGGAGGGRVVRRCAEARVGVAQRLQRRRPERRLSVRTARLSSTTAVGYRCRASSMLIRASSSAEPSSAAQSRTDGSANPASSSAPGTASQSSSTRSTWRIASVRPETASASRAASNEATRASSRPARSSPVVRGLGGLGSRLGQGRLLGQRPCELLVQQLALAWQQRVVDRLGEQRVTEAEGARRPVGLEHLVLDRLAQRLRELQSSAGTTAASSP